MIGPRCTVCAALVCFLHVCVKLPRTDPGLRPGGAADARAGGRIRRRLLRAGFMQQDLAAPFVGWLLSLVAWVRVCAGLVCGCLWAVCVWAFGVVVGCCRWSPYLYAWAGDRSCASLDAALRARRAGFIGGVLVINLRVGRARSSGVGRCAPAGTRLVA